MLLVDENLSFKLPKLISASYQGVKHIDECNLSSSPDEDIFEYAKKTNLCIITKDNDFHNLSLLRGCPPKVVRLACGNQPTKNIAALIIAQKTVIDDFLKDKYTCYLEIYSS